MSRGVGAKALFGPRPLADIQMGDHKGRPYGSGLFLTGRRLCGTIVSHQQG